MIKLVPRIRKIFINKVKLLKYSVCNVAVVNPPRGSFDYITTEAFNVGQIVIVPLRSRICVGIVLGKGKSGIDKSKLRNIIKKIDLPEFTVEFLNFCKWTSDWTMQDLSKVLKMSLSSEKFISSFKNNFVLEYNHNNLAKITLKGSKVIKEILKNSELSVIDCMNRTKVSRGVINKLLKDKVLVFKEKKISKNEYTYRQLTKLSNQQLQTFNLIKSFIKNENNNVFLLDGVTGSGKTKVYFKLVENNIKSEKQTLILLPEIALSTQFIDTFYQHFGVEPYLWHSELSIKERHQTWLSVIKGEAKVVVGARSALYLPFKNLGLIVVDEEHDISYKQEDGVIYNARDMAVSRASIENINIVLASATPSIESLYNASIGKYRRVQLKSRFGHAKMPVINLIDMKKENLPANKWLSGEAIKALKNTIMRKEQSLLFINRRGFSPLTLCKNCGFRFICSNCSSWLVTHKQKNILLCHHCGMQQNLNSDCPSCESKNSFIACGPGVERIAEEIKELFPNIKIAILSSDTLQSFSDRNKIFKDIIKGKVNVIVGTQVSAKGHNFPFLTTVIAVDADLSLSGPDLRASEKTFQLLTQLSGRAGRYKKKGHAYIQSYNPNNNVMQAILEGNREKFVKFEKKSRISRNLPPFGRLASIIIESRDIYKAESFSNKLRKSLQYISQNRIKVLGPAPSPINKLRGWYRFRFLVMGEKSSRLQPFISEWLGKVNVRAGLKVKIDIDPYNFL